MFPGDSGSTSPLGRPSTPPPRIPSAHAVHPWARVGGHCSRSTRPTCRAGAGVRLAHTFRFVELANDVNDHMPDYRVRRLTYGLTRRRKAVNGSRHLLLAWPTSSTPRRPGIAVADVAERLVARGAEVHAVDPTSPSALPAGHRAGVPHGPTAAGADAVVMLNRPQRLRLEMVGGRGSLRARQRRRVLPTAEHVDTSDDHSLDWAGCMTRVLHVTTTDNSPELLLGRSCAPSGTRLRGPPASAPVRPSAGLTADGIVHHTLHHATRAFALGHDPVAARELYWLFRSLRPDMSTTHNPKPGVSADGRPSGPVPLVVNTRHGSTPNAGDASCACLPFERPGAFWPPAAATWRLIQTPEDPRTLARLGVSLASSGFLATASTSAFRPQPPAVRQAFAPNSGWPTIRSLCGLWSASSGEGYGRLFRRARPALLRAARTWRWWWPGHTTPPRATRLTRPTGASADASGVRFLATATTPNACYAGFDIYVLPRTV